MPIPSWLPSCIGARLWPDRHGPAGGASAVPAMPAALPAQAQAPPPDTFRYRLLDGTEGEVPRVLVERCPGSVLAASASDRWAPAIREGRHLLFMHPQRWYEIVDFLASDALPDTNWQPLLAQARILNLQPIVDRLEARTPGVHQEHCHERNDFCWRVVFCDVRARLARGESSQVFSVALSASQTCTLGLTSDGLEVMLGEPADASSSLPTCVQCSLSVPLQRSKWNSHAKISPVERFPLCFEARWLMTGYTLDELVSGNPALAPDALTIRLTLQFSF